MAQKYLRNVKFLFPKEIFLRFTSRNKPKTPNTKSIYKGVSTDTEENKPFARKTNETPKEE